KNQQRAERHVARDPDGIRFQREAASGRHARRAVVGRRARGSARWMDGFSPEGAEMCTRSTPPAGFPVSSYATCGDLVGDPGAGPDKKSAFDAIALELVVRAPTNAKSFSFDFDFYTFEYTEFVCSEFNDAFVAL